MKKYNIEIGRTAEKQLKRLQRKDQERVVAAILDLAENPYPNSHKKLSGYEDMYRIRVGNHRIIYSVDGTRVIITVLKVAHRKDVYR